MTSRQFVEFLKRKIEENGVKKVVPNKDTLKIAWRRAQKIKVVNADIAQVMEVHRRRLDLPCGAARSGDAYIVLASDASSKRT